MRNYLMLLLAAADPILALDQFEYVDSEKLVAELEGQPMVALWYYRRYDERVLRDWLVNCVLDSKVTGTSDLRWRQEMVAAYGLREDSSRLAEITDELAKLEFSPQDYHNMLPLTLLARHGDQDAQQQLLEQPPNIAVKILPYLRTPAALDRLAAIAADSKNDVIYIRSPAVEALCLLGDNRGLEIGLSEEIAAAFHADERRGVGFEDYYSRMLGFNLSGEQINGPSDVRAIIKRKDLTLKPAKIKSVKGPIDWSKYRVKAGVPPLPATPERSPLPKKIRQPKPEKPAAAAASAQKPPADNAGKLIAAAVAIVGLLAVLIWFWRKK